MKFCFHTVVVKSRVTNLLIFLVLLSITGCGLTKPSIYRTLVIKPFEKKMDEYHKKLQVAKALTIKTEISSQIIITQGAPDYFVEYLRARLKILPMTDSRQKILSFEITPQGKIVGSSLEFNLDAPSGGLHEFKLKAEAVYRHEYVQVTDKISFPLKDIPAGQIKYTVPSLNIDSDNNEIHTLASSIAQEEDDLYRVVFNAGRWVSENVQGDMDTATIFTSQKASWVLENRKGVCDEKTNLFIGILRSLGIPAKFITGFVGVNYNYRINFKPHGWAEVYFPSVGWISFDLSYNQLGYIDATHIKLAESVDTSDPITSYEWKSVDISDRHLSDEWRSSNELVSIKDLKIRTKIKKETGSVTPLLEITPKVWYKYLDVGSYNVIEATVVNPHNFYVITDVYLQTPQDLEIMAEDCKMLLMEPGTRKTVHWIVKTPNDMERGLTFVFPVTVVSSRNTLSSMEFRIAKGQGYPKHSFERLKYIVEKKTGQAL